MQGSTHTNIRSSWLVQRLTRRSRNDLVNAFAFGGGLVNGGLSAEAIKLLPFGFDYMGAAEFEFGAVPKALDRMAHYDLVAGIADTDHGSVLYLCDEGHEPDVVERIRGWASKPYSGDTKEMVNLHQALTGDEWASRLVGWLELDNGFAFFTDEQVWRDMCALFGVALIGDQS